MPPSPAPATTAHVQSQVRAVRVGGWLLLAIATLWAVSLQLFAPPGRPAQLAYVYASQIATAVAVLALANERRSLAALRLIGLLLCVEVIAAVNAMALLLDPALAWDATLWTLVVLLGAAGLMPWPATWQAGLAAAAIAAAVPMLAIHPGETLVALAYPRVRIGLTVTLAAAMSVVVADFRERITRRLERQGADQERFDVLSRMSAGLAHQFNNILGGILTNASLLREGAGPEDMRALDLIAESVRRGRSLTKALQRFTPHESVTLKPTDPAAVVETAAALIRASLPPAVRFEVEIEPALPRIAADADHLMQACFELGINALRAVQGRPEPAITLSASRRQGAVRLTMRDNGVGMDEATRRRALEPFFTTRPAVELAGLGLAGVHWVARSHHGQVRLDSEPGLGTSVHIDLPALRDSAPGLPAPAPRRRTVMVVDDDAGVREPLVKILARTGWQVSQAEDGAGALAAVRAAAGGLDLVILDIVLPGGGVELLRELLAAQPGLRVLVASGYGPEGEAARMLAVGAHGFLQKPFEVTELQEAIAGVMGPGSP